MKSPINSEMVVSPNKCWIMLGWLLLIQIFIAIIGRSIAPLGPLIEEDLLLSKSQIGLLPAALFMGQFFIALPAGYFTDKFGTKKILFIVCLILGVSFALITMISNYYFILLLVVLGGIGYGAMHTTSTKGILDWFSQKKRGTAMGIKQMGISLGSVLAVLILLPLAINWGWRAVLFGSCSILIVLGFVAYFFYQDSNSSVANRQQNSSFKGSLKEIVKNKPLLLVSLAALVLVGTQTTLNTYIVFYALEELKLTIFVAGSLLIIAEISGGVGRLVWGSISDLFFKGNRTIVMVIISIISLLCSIIVIFLSSEVSIWLIVVVFSLFGFSTSGFHGVWMNQATESVKGAISGIASGYSLSIGSIGAILITPTFGLIIDKTNSYAMAWLFISLLMVIVVLLLFAVLIVTRKSRTTGS